MPKKKFSDPITDQEITFARLVLSGRMTDQRAAEAAGLNPSTAAYTKAKPRVRDYMLEQRALLQQQHIAQQTEQVHRRNLDREQVLARLWEIANLGPEMTRGSIAGQVKALAMIVAIEGLIPNKMKDHRTGSAEKKPAPPPTQPQIYTAAWLAGRQQQNVEEGLAIPGVEAPEDAPLDPGPDPVPDPVQSPDRNPHPGQPFDPGESTITNAFTRSETQSAPRAAFAPEIRVPYGIQKNRFGRRR